MLQKNMYIKKQELAGNSDSRLLLSAAVIALCLCNAAISAEESPSQWNAPLTEHGHPDLQGNWSNPYVTPLVRPSALGTQQAYSTEEAKILQDRATSSEFARLQPIDPDRPAPPLGGNIDQSADGNFETAATVYATINGEIRTSLIVDPPNGQFPLKASGRDWTQEFLAAGFAPLDGPEMRSPFERCVASGGPMPLMFTFGGAAGGNPSGDNPIRNIQIIQNKDYVVILWEYFSQVRIIRLDSDHMDDQGAKWMGDSVAHYEGSSLIINSQGIRPEQSSGFVRFSEELELVERFTPLNENEMIFSYTISDPAIYEQAVTAEILLNRMSDDLKLYEYACHEGNYSLPSILRAERMKENGLL